MPRKEILEFVRSDLSFRHAEAIVEILPKRPLIHRLFDIHIESAKLSKARKAFGRALSLDPNFEKAAEIQALINRPHHNAGAWKHSEKDPFSSLMKKAVPSLRERLYMFNAF